MKMHGSGRRFLVALTGARRAPQRRPAPGLRFFASAASAASAAPAVGDFSAVRVVPCPTGHALESDAAFAADETMFRFTGKLCGENIGDRSLMVGRDAHLLSHPPEQPWVYLNHSFRPTVTLSHPAVGSAEETPPVLTAKAAVDIEPGTPLTIDYTLHEWEMHAGGFRCLESGQLVRGFKHLNEADKEKALVVVGKHLQDLHAEEVKKKERVG